MSHSPALYRNLPPPSVLTSLIVLGAIAALAVFAPLIAPFDPNQQVDIVGGRLLPPLTTMWLIELTDGDWMLADELERTATGLRLERAGRTEVLPASAVSNLTDTGVDKRRFFLFGSDKFSRDVFSRWLYGARSSLSIGFSAVALAVAVGVTVGCLAALGGRLTDLLLMRLADGLLAFPWFFLLIALVAIFPTDIWTLIILLGLTGWMGISRLTRAQLRSLSQREFILAARAMGISSWQLLRRHLLPNALTPVATDATLRVGNLILVEASLSYLGLGIRAPQASWGNMIADGQSHLLSSWWVAAAPGLSIVVCVVALTLVSDGLQSLLEPRSSRH